MEKELHDKILDVANYTTWDVTQEELDAMDDKTFEAIRQSCLRCNDCRWLRNGFHPCVDEGKNQLSLICEHFEWD